MQLEKRKGGGYAWLNVSFFINKATPSFRKDEIGILKNLNKLCSTLETKSNSHLNTLLHICKIFIKFYLLFYLILKLLIYSTILGF